MNTKKTSGVYAEMASKMSPYDYVEVPTRQQAKSLENAIRNFAYRSGAEIKGSCQIYENGTYRVICIPDTQATAYKGDALRLLAFSPPPIRKYERRSEQSTNMPPLVASQYKIESGISFSKSHVSGIALVVEKMKEGDSVAVLSNKERHTFYTAIRRCEGYTAVSRRIETGFRVWKVKKAQPLTKNNEH